MDFKYNISGPAWFEYKFEPAEKEVHLENHAFALLYFFQGTFT